MIRRIKEIGLVSYLLILIASKQLQTQKEKQEVRKAHYHPNSEECIYVLDGEAITITDKKKHHLNKGDAIIISKGEKHYTVNIGKIKLSLICFFPTENVEIILEK